jgi:hypothetical protein
MEMGEAAVMICLVTSEPFAFAFIETPCSSTRTDKPICFRLRVRLINNKQRCIRETGRKVSGFRTFLLYLRFKAESEQLRVVVAWCPDSDTVVFGSTRDRKFVEAVNKTT